MSSTNDQTHIGGANTWPDLPFNEWKDTCATLQLWT
jgi:hypothetical protein